MFFATCLTTRILVYHDPQRNKLNFGVCENFLNSINHLVYAERISEKKNQYAQKCITDEKGIKLDKVKT